MNAETIAAALGGKRGRCQCPSCAEAGRDRSKNNLNVTERDGKVLVRCFAGCDQGDVISALRARGLWPERERRDFTPADRREWARRVVSK